MTERWWRRRKFLDSWFTNLLDEAGKGDKAMNDMIRQVFESPSERRKARKHYVHQFGTVPLQEVDGSQITEENEPLIDIVPEGANVTVVAELLGIDQSCIGIHATEDKLTISVDSPNCKYHKELALPSKVEPKTATSTFRNGVLQIWLKKANKKRLFIT